jgi:hypothetical protein
MKNKTIKMILCGMGLLFANQIPAHATSVKIDDLSFNVSVSPALGTEMIAARIGTWSAGVFTAGIGGAGFYDNEFNELNTTLSAVSNSEVGISSGTLLALAIYKSTSGTPYSDAVLQAVLTDSTWVMPTLEFGLTQTIYAPTANAVAVVGSYDFAGGNQIVTLTNLAAIPEPSVASLLALGTVGLVALRVRRKS